MDSAGAYIFYAGGRDGWMLRLVLGLEEGVPEMGVGQDYGILAQAKEMKQGKKQEVATEGGMEEKRSADGASQP